MSASVALLMGAAVFGAFTVYVWMRRGSPGGKGLVVMLVAGVWYTATYALELSSKGLVAKSFWGDVKYLGVCLLPPAWLVFTLQYTGRGRWLKRRLLLLLSVEPLLVLTLLTIPATRHLIHVYPARAANQRFPVVKFGPVGWVNVFYSYALSIYSTGLFVMTLAALARPYRKQARALIVALLVPFGMNIAYNFNVGPFGRVDLTPFAFFFAVVVLVWGIFRLRLLDIIPVARTRIVETMQDGVMVLDAYQRVVELNPAAQGLMGCTASQAVGRPLGELLPDHATLLDRSKTSPALVEIRLRVGSAIRAFDVTISPIPDGANGESGKLLVFRDVSERKMTEERLERMAHYDPLTGLPNRKLFADRLNQTVIRARRNSELVGLLFLDVDHFKDVNDTLGHDVGDMLLQQLAIRLKGCVRAEDTVARLSGGEFTVLLPQTESPTDAAVAANRILESLAQPILAGGHELYVSASIGICVWPKDGEDPGTLVRNADVAMYRAKAKGRNRTEFHAIDLSTHAERRLELEGELHRALERRELRVHYQPIVSLATGVVVSLEALVRWQHPKQGLIWPSQFLWRAEETGLIERIGRWVLEEACEDAVRWPRSPGRRPVSVAVNLSGRQLNRAGIAGEIEDVIRQVGIEPGRLVLEISEGTVMDDAVAAARIFHDLRRLGVTLSLDDFGTGSTSLSQLGRFPLDVLKIDRLFVQRLRTDPGDAIVVQAMMSLAHALGLLVVAEGVETTAQLHLLKGFGCDLAQGFLISEPLPASQVAGLLDSPELARAITA